MWRSSTQFLCSTDRITLTVHSWTIRQVAAGAVYTAIFIWPNGRCALMRSDSVCTLLQHEFCSPKNNSAHPTAPATLWHHLHGRRLFFFFHIHPSTIRNNPRYIRQTSRAMLLMKIRKRRRTPHIIDDYSVVCNAPESAYVRGGPTAARKVTPANEKHMSTLTCGGLAVNVSSIVYFRYSTAACHKPVSVSSHTSQGLLCQSNTF